MAFVGLVPSEHSSGDETRPGRHHQNRQRASAPRARRIRLALSPPSLRQRDACGARQRGAPADVIARAWTAQQRLHRRYQRLAARGKPKQHIVTAVARELTGFVWAALTQ